MPTHQHPSQSRIRSTAEQVGRRGPSSNDDGTSAPSSSFWDSVLVVGYTVTSLNTSGNNGWWRITKLPAFAVKGSTLEFFAQAAKWYGSSARYKVTVYWVSAG